MEEFNLRANHFFLSRDVNRSERKWLTVLAQGDNGKLQPSYSHLLGNLAAGGIANAYHPEASRGVGLTFQTLGVTTGANAIGNLFREFLLRDLEPSIPGFANGKKAFTSTASHP